MKNILLTLALLVSFSSFSQILFENNDFENYLAENKSLLGNYTYYAEPKNPFNGGGGYMVRGNSWGFLEPTKIEIIKDTIIGYLDSGKPIKNNLSVSSITFIKNMKSSINISKEFFVGKYKVDSLYKGTKFTNVSFWKTEGEFAHIAYENSIKFRFKNSKNYTEIIFSGGKLVKEIKFFNTKGDLIDNFNFNKFFKSFVDKPDIKNLDEVIVYVKKIYKRYVVKNGEILCNSCIFSD